MIENRESFFARIQPLLAPSELLKVEIAYALAKHAHRSQVRKECDQEGHPVRYFEHLRRTSLILIDELEVHDTNLIIAALMHDSIEDTRDISAEMLEHLFGAKVSKMVKLLTKEPKNGYYERLKRHGDIDTILVKGCDRLDNVRSLSQCSVEFQKKQVAETRNVVMPLLSYFYAKDDTRISYLIDSINSELNLIEKSFG